MPRPSLTFGQAETVDTAKDFFANIITGLQDGDIFSWMVFGIAVWVLARLLFAKWAFSIVNNTMIFGGIGYAVWFGAEWLADDKGYTLAAKVLLYGGGVIVFVFYFVMLYLSILKHIREKEAPKKAKAGAGAKAAPKKTVKGSVTAGGTTTRIGAGPLQHHNLPIHQTTTPATLELGPAATAPASGGARPTAAGPADDDVGRIEQVLTKLNIVSKARDQKFLTVVLLILVAEFGVFTGKTIAAPDAKTGMVLAGIFAVGAVVFVKTSYKDYMRGVIHFVFAAIFALALSMIMLVYWQTWCTPELIEAGTECATQTASTRWGTVLSPDYYFASDGLIAAISAIAFSTLLTKGGG